MEEKKIIPWICSALTFSTELRARCVEEIFVGKSWKNLIERQKLPLSRSDCVWQRHTQYVCKSQRRRATTSNQTPLPLIRTFVHFKSHTFRPFHSNAFAAVQWNVTNVRIAYQFTNRSYWIALFCFNTRESREKNTQNLWNIVKFCRETVLHVSHVIKVALFFESVYDLWRYRLRFDRKCVYDSCHCQSLENRLDT